MSQFPDSVLAAAVDAHGAVVVAGATDNPSFPTTPGSFQPNPAGQFDAFVAKIAPDGGSLLWATYLGGAGGSQPSVSYALAVALDQAGAVYVAGATSAPDFPTTPGAYDRTFNGVTDAFVAKFALGAPASDDDDDEEDD